MTQTARSANDAARRAAAIFALASALGCDDAPVAPNTSPDARRVSPSGAASGTPQVPLRMIFENPNTGFRAGWLVCGGSVVASAGEHGVAPVAWGIVGVGDFSHDGTTDLLLRNDVSNALTDWVLTSEETALVRAEESPDYAPHPWRAGGVGDFDANGGADVVWHNPDSEDVVVWLMNGMRVRSAARLGSIPTPWRLATVGDLDGDGRPDLLWENPSTGARRVWRMTGTTLGAVVDLGAVDARWRLAAVGDYDGDGHSDVFFQQTVTGEVVVWRMHGTQFLDARPVGGPPSAPGNLRAVWRSATSSMRCGA